MDTSLSGKVIAITGAASGIGLACARRMLAAGATVVLVDRAEDRLAELRAEMGEKALSVTTDLLDPASVEQMMPQILAQAGRLDAFHANAGSYVAGEVIEGDPDAWDRMLTLNVNAVFRTVRAVLPHMAERGSGDVVVTSSIAGHVPVMVEPIYTASKHAVQAFVHTVRRQVAPRGIGLLAVAPGPVDTAPHADWHPTRLADTTAAGGLLEPEEVAEAVHFMLTRPRTVTIRDLVILPGAFDI
jgi:ribitol 2-dehydrogenase